MDDILLKSRLNRPIGTGTPPVGYPQGTQKPQVTGTGESFQKVLEQQLSSRQSLSFSKHAIQRIEERDINISPANMNRLQEGVELAQQKGLDNTLIIVDQSAFIVSVKNGTVVTALGDSELTGSVITNINGTVII